MSEEEKVVDEAVEEEEVSEEVVEETPEEQLLNKGCLPQIAGG